jgi:hypothetical protein
VQGFAYNITNGVFIPPFEGPPNENIPTPDNFFMYLFEYLKAFNDVNDIRKKIQKEFDIKNLFMMSFKNPAMEKLKSLMDTGKKDKKPEKANSTPKYETSFRRNSRIIMAPHDLTKLQKLNSELRMDSIKEVSEKI